MAAADPQSTDPGTALCRLCIKPHREQDLIEVMAYGAMKPFGESFLWVVLVCPECEPRASHCPVCGGAFLVEEHGSRDTKYERATYEEVADELLACPSCDPDGDWGYLEGEEDDDDEPLDLALSVQPGAPRPG
jgi:hypothetical protein